MSRLEVEHLYKVFGRRPQDAVARLRQGADREELRADGATAAVIDASVTVEPGEIFVVMGLSGSGKSTLLRMLNGLLAPTAGRVLFDGQDLTRLPTRDLRRLRARRISMVFQHFALFPHRSVLDNAAYGLAVQGVPRPERERRAAEALALAGLAGWESSWPDELSGGMQQRVGLARALATDADLLLMDESFSALDPLIRKEMQDQLLGLQRTLRKTIVFITHDLNEATRLGDRIAVMRDGRIVQTGTPREIVTQPANDYVASFVQDVDRSRILTADAVMEPPAVTVRPDDRLSQVRRTLDGREQPVAFVVDRNGVLIGTISRDTAAGTRREADADGDRAVRDLMDADPVAVAVDAGLAELFAPCANSALPVPVVDGERRLLGVVPRAGLLAALGDRPVGGDPRPGPVPPPNPAPPTPVPPPRSPGRAGDDAVPDRTVTDLPGKEAAGA